MVNFLHVIKREKYVILHGQSFRFRIVKYCVLFPLAIVLFIWGGWAVVVRSFLFLAIAGIVMHFFFRWKTNGWKKSWGLYKKLKHLP